MRVTIVAAVVTTIVVAVLLGGATAWTFWPYNDLDIATDGVLVGAEERPHDVPVLRSGTPIQLSVDYCNHGVAVTSERWLNVYGVFGAYDTDDPEPTQSIRLPDARFSPPDGIPPCGYTVAVIEVPDYVRTGRIYSLENRNTYRPNPLRSVTVTYESEKFLLLESEPGSG